MGKPAEHPVTKILNLLKSLSDGEKQIIYDHCRPAPKPRQKGKGRTHTRQVLCVVGNCFLAAGDRIHQPTTDGYHPFRGPAGAAAVHTERKPSQKRKAQTVSVASETTAGIPSDARCAKPDCVGFSDDNIHHKQSMPGYHEFVEPAGEAKGAGV